MEAIRGMVINLNAFGATVRLEGGQLATASAGEVETHRAEYERSLNNRKTLDFQVRSQGRHATVVLTPQIRDPELEEQIAAYLKMTEEWEKPDAAPAHERHFLQKKRRAAFFESRHATDR
jgi:hypothetical protein